MCYQVSKPIPALAEVFAQAVSEIPDDSGRPDAGALLLHLRRKVSELVSMDSDASTGADALLAYGELYVDAVSSCLAISSGVLGSVQTARDAWVEQCMRDVQEMLTPAPETVLNATPLGRFALWTWVLAALVADMQPAATARGGCEHVLGLHGETLIGVCDRLVRWSSASSAGDAVRRSGSSWSRLCAIANTSRWEVVCVLLRWCDGVPLLVDPRVATVRHACVVAVGNTSGNGLLAALRSLATLLHQTAGKCVPPTPIASDATHDDVGGYLRRVLDGCWTMFQDHLRGARQTIAPLTACLEQIVFSEAMLQHVRVDASLREACVHTLVRMLDLSVPRDGLSSAMFVRLVTMVHETPDLLPVFADVIVDVALLSTEDKTNRRVAQ